MGSSFKPIYTWLLSLFLFVFTWCPLFVSLSSLLTKKLVVLDWNFPYQIWPNFNHIISAKSLFPNKITFIGVEFRILTHLLGYTIQPTIIYFTSFILRYVYICIYICIYIYIHIDVYVYTHTSLYIDGLPSESLTMEGREREKRKEGRARVHFFKEGDFIVMLEARVSCICIHTRQRAPEGLVP